MDGDTHTTDMVTGMDGVTHITDGATLAIILDGDILATTLVIIHDTTTTTLITTEEEDLQLTMAQEDILPEAPITLLAEVMPEEEIILLTEIVIPLTDVPITQTSEEALIQMEEVILPVQISPTEEVPHKVKAIVMTIEDLVIQLQTEVTTTQIVTHPDHTLLAHHVQ